MQHFTKNIENNCIILVKDINNEFKYIIATDFSIKNDDYLDKYSIMGNKYNHYKRINNGYEIIVKFFVSKGIIDIRDFSNNCLILNNMIDMKKNNTIYTNIYKGVHIIKHEIDFYNSWCEYKLLFHAMFRDNKAILV